MKNTNLYQSSPDDFIPGPEIEIAFRELQAEPHNGTKSENMRLALLAGYERARLNKEWNNQ